MESRADEAAASRSDWNLMPVHSFECKARSCDLGRALHNFETWRPRLL